MSRTFRNRSWWGDNIEDDIEYILETFDVDTSSSIEFDDTMTVDEIYIVTDP